MEKEILEKDQFILTVGKRKTAVAQVKFYPQGKGQILINKKNLEDYFPFFSWQEIVKEPLVATNFLNKGDFIVKVEGGGTKAQAEAIRLGIARALVSFNPDFRKILKPLGLLRRDPRIKERKKPGLKRARRAPQWQKR
jgi:small subunit ribosomal protein S9